MMPAADPFKSVRSLAALGRADQRLGQTWSPLQRVKNGVLYRLAMTALALARALPLSALARAGRGLGVASYVVLRGPRETALANLARVYPAMPDGERRALVRRTFVTMGELLADAVALLRPGVRGGPLLALTPEARAVLDAARLEGRGVLFASAHLGPWERVAASLAAAGLPFAALARQSYDPRFSRLYERLRGARGIRLVWRSSAKGAHDARAVVRALRDGCVVGVPMDLRSRVASCETPFLGHPAPTPVGPAKIALRTGAAVVVGTVAPGPPGSPFVITATRIPSSDLGKDASAAAELTTRINHELSARIEALPHAWVWMHERW
jgi:KDO2-lipid IV(A) lauroyltransferase